MNSTLDEIKRKIDIVEFVNSYVALKKAGRNYKGLCPFHHEKSPSFVVSPERQIWHCFGSCHEGGDIVKFLMKWDNITFPEALRELATKAGVTIEEEGYDDNTWKHKERLLEINFLASEFFSYILQNASQAQQARTYLEDRGITDKIAKTFKLGYAPQSWDSLLRFFKKKGISEQEGYTVGMLIRNDNGHFYDRFRDRLMFPLIDTRGNIIGFSGRILSTGVDTKGAKYINTPETPLYHKRETLYGIHVAKEAIKKENNVLIVEGEFDMITPFRHGIENVVAIKGSALTREQLTVLKRYTERVTLALDADAAGEDAARRGIEEAERLNIEVQVITFEAGKDPDEMARHHLTEFKKALKHPAPFYDFIIKTSRRKHPGNDPYQKKQFGDEVIPFIARIQNPIVQSHYLKHIATILEVSEDSIQKEIRYYFRKKKQYQRPTPQTDTQEDAREVMLQKYLLRRIFQTEEPGSLVSSVEEVLSESDFTVPALGKIFQNFVHYFSGGSEKNDINVFIDKLPKELQPFANEMYLNSVGETDEEAHSIKKLALEMKRATLKQRITEGFSAEQDDENDQSPVSDLMRELKEVEKMLSTM